MIQFFVAPLKDVLVALLFGLEHLPALTGIVALTPLLFFRTLLLNMIVACGWLYMRRGLESAMLRVGAD